MARLTAPQTNYPVVILGAGPAGLAMGYQLASRGVDFVILEKGPVAGDSFANFPRNIFFGPWLNNMLPGSRIHWKWKARRSTQPGYTSYLQEYARQHRLPVHTDVEVLATRPQDEGFSLETNKGTFWAKLIVNATGYFAKPYIPQYPGLLETHTPHIHVSKYRDPDTVRRILGRSAGRILVVGKRLSAGETMCELHRAGFQVSLCHRGKLRFGPSPTQEALISPVVWLQERLAVFLRLKLNSFPLMAGGESEALVKSKQVLTYPEISTLDGEHVHFNDGSTARFDLIIFATGYRAALDHLANLPNLGTPPELAGLESVHYPGLFFLGIDGLRTYRSRFLRGICEDALALGELVARRALKFAGRPTHLPELRVLEMEPRELANEATETFAPPLG